MKKSRNKNGQKVESSSITISATLVETHMLKYLVEKIASSRFNTRYFQEKVQPGWEAIETSSLEADVSGYINISEKTDLFNMPFENCFIFTCIKAKNAGYDLKWASSLS